MTIPPRDGITFVDHPADPTRWLIQRYRDGAPVGEPITLPKRQDAVTRLRRIPLDVETAPAWALVVAINHGGPVPELSSALQDALFQASWDLQDGYGEPGYMPVQGWDWSGIRDSAAPTKTAIGEMIRARLLADGITIISTIDYPR